MTPTLIDLKLTDELIELYRRINLALSEKDWSSIDKRDLRDLRNWARQLRDAAEIDFSLRTTWFNLKDFIFEVMSRIGQLLKASQPCWIERYIELSRPTTYTAQVSGVQGELRGLHLEPYLALTSVLREDGKTIRKSLCPGLPLTKRIKAHSLNKGDWIRFTARIGSKGDFVKPTVLDIIRHPQYQTAPVYKKAEILRLVEVVA